MWLFTNFGFFSVVQKSGTTDLTVRSRVRSDLDALRVRYLPELGPTQAKKGTDYPWRASVSHTALAAAMGQIVMDCHYSNYKNEVAARQGKSRAHRYAHVWDALYGMPEEEANPKGAPATKPHPHQITQGSPGVLPIIYDRQATFVARLIRELETALLHHFEVEQASDLRWGGGDLSPFQVPEYDRLVFGLMALGWVFEQYNIDDLLDLDKINARPVATVGQMSLAELRWYLHTLHRADKWADGYASRILEAFASGALQLVAQRLDSEFRPWNEASLPWNEPADPGKVAYGGVLFDGDGRVLLREPRNHYDGYVWTFAKGKPNQGEAPKATALREVEEETGVKARILAPIPDEFAGGTTVNRYFLMVPDGPLAPLPPDCPETITVKWCEPDEARALIAKTKNALGRKRDLKVLEAGLEAWRKQDRP